jgi:hypothetical protein
MGIYGKVRHRKIFTRKNAALRCDIMQFIYGAHNLVDQEEQYSHVPHNVILVNDEPHR